MWLSVWSEVQIVCILSSRCHCHPKTPSSLASFKSRLVLPLAYPGCTGKEIVKRVLLLLHTVENATVLKASALTGAVLLLVEKRLSILSLRSTCSGTVAVLWPDRKLSCPTRSGRQCESPLRCLVAPTTSATPAMHATSTDSIVNLTVNNCSAPLSFTLI